MEQAVDQAVAAMNDGKMVVTTVGALAARLVSSSAARPQRSILRTAA
jgi:hypothetical protein